MLKTPANLLAANDRTGREGGKETTARQSWGAKEMERVIMKSRKEEGGSSLSREWVGGGGAIDGKDERDGGKQQHHFSSLLTVLPSMAHDDRRQNGHLKHQCSGSDTQHHPFNTKQCNYITPPGAT